MKIGIINDEISDNLEEAFFLSNYYNLDYISLRSQEGINVFFWSKKMCEKAHNLSVKYNIPIYSISSPFFKSSFSENNTYKNIDYPLPMLLSHDIYLIFDTWLSKVKICNPKIIRIFSPINSKEINNETINKWKFLLNRSTDIAEKYNISLAIENEPACYLNTANTTNLFISEIGDKRIKMVWDPGNDFSKKNHYNDFSSNNIVEIHLKDWLKKSNKWVALGDGNLPIKRVLSSENNISHVTIETHAGSNKEEKKKFSVNSIIKLKEIISENRK